VGTPATGPGPANAMVAALLNGAVPLGAPPPHIIATDTLLAPNKRLFLVALNNLSGPVAVGRGVLAADDDVESRGPNSRSAQDLASLAPGTPIVVLNLHARALHGVFLARGPAVKELIPGLLPRMGARSFNVHIPVVSVADAAPMLEPVFGPILRGMPTHIGYLGGRESHDICARMFATLPLPQQFLTAALLVQMNATGAYPFLTGPDGSPQPVGPTGQPLAPEAALAALAAAGPNSLPLPVVPDPAGMLMPPPPLHALAGGPLPLPLPPPPHAVMGGPPPPPEWLARQGGGAGGGGGGGGGEWAGGPPPHAQKRGRE
jgi:hypothetical protein